MRDALTDGPWNVGDELGGDDDGPDGQENVGASSPQTHCQDGIQTDGKASEYHPVQGGLCASQTVEEGLTQNLMGYPTKDNYAAQAQEGVKQIPEHEISQRLRWAWMVDFNYNSVS